MGGLKQGCIFWPFPPPLEGGEKKRHFLEFGEENRPLEKKKFQNWKKNLSFNRKLFLNHNLSCKNNTLSFNFIIREAQFSFERDSAQTKHESYFRKKISSLKYTLYSYFREANFHCQNTTICLVKPFSSLRKDPPSIIGEARFWVWESLLS